MDNRLHEINHDPRGSGITIRSVRPVVTFLAQVLKRLGNRFHLTNTCATGHNDEITNWTLARNIKNNHILALHVETGTGALYCERPYLGWISV